MPTGGVQNDWISPRDYHAREEFLHLDGALSLVAWPVLPRRTTPEPED